MDMLHARDDHGLTQVVRERKTRMDLQIFWRETDCADCWWVGCGGKEEGGVKNDFWVLGLTTWGEATVFYWADEHWLWRH